MTTPTNVRPFTTPKNMIVPAASREVYTPVSGTGVKVVVDLIPTVNVTDVWPVWGVTTYGEMDYGNRTDNHAGYDNYVLQKMEKDLRHPNMTKLTFVPNFDPTIASTIPVDTMWSSDAATWPSVLTFLQTFRNTSMPIPVQTATGTLYVPRFTVVYGLRRSVSCHSKMKTEKFVSNKPFDLSGAYFRVLQPTDLMWDMPGTSGSIERCLHKTYKLQAARDNIDWITSSPRYMVFPTTEIEDWAPIIWWEVQLQDVLYVAERNTLYPPPQNPASVYVE